MFRFVLFKIIKTISAWVALALNANGNVKYHGQHILMSFFVKSLFYTALLYDPHVHVFVVGSVPPVFVVPHVPPSKKRCPGYFQNIIMLSRVGRFRVYTAPLNRRFSAVTANAVKELREKSGAPMMECKKALSAEGVNGDIRLAMDWLRAKGIARASANADRVSKEGLIALSANPSGSVTLLEVNSETGYSTLKYIL